MIIRDGIPERYSVNSITSIKLMANDALTRLLLKSERTSLSLGAQTCHEKTRSHLSLIEFVPV
jgi:hypothetical protein